MDPAPLKPIPGSTVRLKVDIRNQEGTMFRSGLRMKILDSDRGFHLKVKVRGEWHLLFLLKKDYPHYFEVVEAPKDDK